MRQPLRISVLTGTKIGLLGWAVVIGSVTWIAAVVVVVVVGVTGVIGGVSAGISVLVLAVLGDDGEVLLCGLANNSVATRVGALLVLECDSPPMSAVIITACRSSTKPKLSARLALGF